MDPQTVRVESSSTASQPQTITAQEATLAARVLFLNKDRPRCEEYQYVNKLHGGNNKPSLYSMGGIMSR
jgi:transposase-like protein